MDPFLWGFVRGGAVTMAFGLLPLAAYAAHAGCQWLAWLCFGGTLLMLAVFVANERRRPW